MESLGIQRILLNFHGTLKQASEPSKETMLFPKELARRGDPSTTTCEKNQESVVIALWEGKEERGKEEQTTS